jgi:glycosyltransferase involved in cell wall biosynthesis
MRIVCISASKIPSSTANSIQVMKACQALQQLGHEVKLWVPALVTSSSPSPNSGLGNMDQSPETAVGDKDASLDWDRLSAFYGLQTRFEVGSIPAYPLLRRYDFSLKAALKAKAAKADLLYIWPLQAAVLGLIFKMPVVVELHGPPEGKLGVRLFWLLRRIPGKKRLLPITQALANLLLRLDTRPFEAGEVVVTPNGVDLERYQALPGPTQARLSLQIPEGLSVGYTGHFYAGRGMGLLLELARRFPKVQFLWVGGQPADVQTWKQRLAQESLTNVRLTGFVDNQSLPMYQAAADILLMPYEQVVTGSSGGNSAEYCSPMKMFEYMACGRAIITSNLPVIREVLSEANCVFCPPDDVDHWSTALESLIENAELRNMLGAQCKQDVSAYTWVKRAEKALAGFSTVNW